MCGFHYDLISRRFKNTATENIKYGWEIVPVLQHIGYQQDNGQYAELDPMGLPVVDNDTPF